MMTFRKRPFGALEPSASFPDGFTLIEILLVAALLALFMGAALPRLAGSLKSFSLENDLNNLQKILRYAQYQAVLERKIFRVIIDQSSQTYALERQVEREDFRAFESVHLGGKSEHRLGRGSEFLAAQREIYFFPDGTLTAPFRLQLRNERGARVDVTHGGLGLFKAEWRYD